MNEEEKKAINDFKRTLELYETKPIDKTSVMFDEFDYKNVKMVLKLIEKLLKKNEHYYKVINVLNAEKADWIISYLEKKEVELINENEHYKDLIYALKTYYDITEEDLEKSMKNDR